MSGLQRQPAQSPRRRPAESEWWVVISGARGLGHIASQYEKATREARTSRRLQWATFTDLTVFAPSPVLCGDYNRNHPIMWRPSPIGTPLRGAGHLSTISKKGSPRAGVRKNSLVLIAHYLVVAPPSAPFNNPLPKPRSAPQLESGTYSRQARFDRHSFAERLSRPELRLFAAT